MQGGLQSIEEALTVGVPLIAIPFFSDQDFNVKKIEEKGIGIRLDFAEITKEKLLFALDKVINDSLSKKRNTSSNITERSTPNCNGSCNLVDGLRTKTQRSLAPAYCSCGHAMVPVPATRCHCLHISDFNNNSHNRVHCCQGCV
uniref:Glucuronosyltransferase n=1 Tax=Timema genevievae TaxID=629358 RepID=A0A7R9PSR2_TIMGE|nr:unnamed protein product [Timema genevievae]